eukprot:scaffold471646_cov47-Prasinocladus_malaysianus.AAC.1
MAAGKKYNYPTSTSTSLRMLHAPEYGLSRGSRTGRSVVAAQPSSRALLVGGRKNLTALDATSSVSFRQKNSLLRYISDYLSSEIENASRRGGAGRPR